MTESEVRNWLGKYFLIITIFTGGYILLFSGTMAFPGLNREEAWSIFQIIIPVLVGQLAIIFRWFGELVSGESQPGRIANIPSWVVKGPPIGTTALLVLMLFFMIIGNNREEPWGPTPETVSSIVTFVVSVLNASTIFIVAGYFGKPEQADADSD
ncbi:MAG: hypothetical protein AAFQ15_11610 [Pseudomonadota bacterium]